MDFEELIEVCGGFGGAVDEGIEDVERYGFDCGVFDCFCEARAIFVEGCVSVRGGSEVFEASSGVERGEEGLGVVRVDAVEV